MAPSSGTSIGGTAGSPARLFQGRVEIDYGQVYVDGSGGMVQVDLEESFRGQTNGLCGAAQPHFLFLITGRHTGAVDLTIDILHSAPPLDRSWHDVVEASFAVGSADVHLIEWGGGGHQLMFSGPGFYRVRYSGKNAGEAHANEHTHDRDAPPTDSYQLQFWPAPAGPDAILIHTTWGEYWHNYASHLPPN